MKTKTKIDHLEKLKNRRIKQTGNSHRDWKRNNKTQEKGPKNNNCNSKITIN